MTGGARRSLLALLAVLVSGAALLAHHAIAGAGSPSLGATVAIVPALLLVLAAIWRSGGRSPLPWLFFALGAALVLALWQHVEDHFQGLYFLQHVGSNLLLAAVFGRTLLPGREPLCTRFARAVHGSPLTASVTAYSRKVTVAWTLFFLALAGASVVLFLGGHLEAWSILANLLTGPLVALMFLAEFGIRRRVIRDSTHGHLLDSVRAFWRRSDPPGHTPAP